MKRLVLLIVIMLSLSNVGVAKRASVGVLEARMEHRLFSQVEDVVGGKGRELIAKMKRAGRSASVASLVLALGVTSTAVSQEYVQGRWLPIEQAGSDYAAPRGGGRIEHVQQEDSRGSFWFAITSHMSDISTVGIAMEGGEERESDAILVGAQAFLHPDSISLNELLTQARLRFGRRAFVFADGGMLATVGAHRLNKEMQTTPLFFSEGIGGVGYRLSGDFFTYGGHTSLKLKSGLGWLSEASWGNTGDGRYDDTEGNNVDETNIIGMVGLALETDGVTIGDVMGSDGFFSNLIHVIPSGSIEVSLLKPITSGGVVRRVRANIGVLSHFFVTIDRIDSSNFREPYTRITGNIVLR